VIIISFHSGYHPTGFGGNWQWLVEPRQLFASQSHSRWKNISPALKAGMLVFPFSIFNKISVIISYD